MLCNLGENEMMMVVMLCPEVTTLGPEVMSRLTDVKNMNVRF